MSIERYAEFLELNFGGVVKLSEWVDHPGLPMYLMGFYAFKVCDYYQQSWLLMQVLPGNPIAVGGLLKHLEILKSYNQRLPVILLLEQLTSYQRKELIKAKIAFIHLGKQVYIRELGMIIFNRQLIKSTASDEFVADQRLMPGTQAVLLYLLINDQPANQTMIAEQLDMSRMSVSRAYNELQAQRLIDQSSQQMWSWSSNQRQQLWKQALPLLSKPKVKIHYVRKSSLVNYQNILFVSGESALAHYSMLSIPKIEVYGLTQIMWDKIESQLDIIEYGEQDCCVIEVWRYGLPLLDGYVHPLGLALLLKDVKDARVQGAIDTMVDDYFDSQRY
jgi:hypothetical protein